VKYYSYNEPGDPECKTNVVVTLSEDEIIEQYWGYWYGRMCTKYGKEKVDVDYNKQDCIDDFCIIHWAWESASE
jgi:hypothetical protein